MEKNKKWRNAATEHVCGILLSIIVGLVVVSPQLFLRFELGERYRGIILTGTDSEEFYLNRIREAYDGYYSLSSPEIADYKNGPYAQPAMGELIEALLAKIFFLTPIQMAAFGKFLFPALLSLLLYFFSYSLTRNKYFSAASPVFIILSTGYLLHAGDVWKFAQLRWGEISGFIEYTRPIHPQLSSVFFFLWLLVFTLWIQRKKEIFLFFSSLLLGLMFYVYLYSWTLAFTIVVLIFASQFFRKRLGLYASKKNLLLLLFFALIISIPYWINNFELLGLSFYPELQKRFGFYSSRSLLWSNMLFVDFFLLFFTYFKKKKDENFYILLAYLASLALLINQQFVTGVRFFPGHWHWYFVAPITLFLTFFFFSERILFRLKTSTQRFLFIGIIILSIFAGFFRQYSGYLLFSRDAMENQKYAEVFHWLNANAKKDETVLSHDWLNLNIPIYTHNNTVLSSWGHFYAIPQERLEKMAFLSFYLRGATDKNIESYITQDEWWLRSVLYGYYKRKAYACARDCFTQEELEALQEKYLDFYKNLDFAMLMKESGASYAVWDSKAGPEWKLEKFLNFSLLQEIQGVKIFRILY